MTKFSDTPGRPMRVVLNGKSAQSDEVRAAIMDCRQQGHDVQVRVTWETGQAAEFAEEAARDGYPVVVAAGGDGTVNEVATGVLRAGETTRTAIGILPLGTANDFATGCHIPRDLSQAFVLLTSLEPRPIDVGMINDRPFINVASAGLGAEVTSDTPAGIKRLLGGAAYSLVGLLKAFTLTPHSGKIITPDGTFEGQMMLMGIGNGRLAGGGFHVAPRALLDDGRLDLVIVPDVAFPETGSLVSEMMRLEAEEPERIVYRQLSQFDIESDRPMQMNLDGEPKHAHQFQVRVLPRRLQFLLPPDAPFAGQPAAGA